MWSAEDRIQIDIVNFIEAYYKDLIVFHVPNGGARHMLEAKKLKQMGVRPGIPDLAILPAPNNRGIHNVYFMEVKTPAKRSKTSNEQDKFQNECVVRGFGWCVVRSVEDAKLALNAWQIRAGRPPLFVLENQQQKVF